MAGNRGVVYVGKGNVKVQDIDFPELVLKDGPGVNPLNVGRKCEHGVILKVVTQTSAAVTSIWCADGQPPRQG